MMIATVTVASRWLSARCNSVHTKKAIVTASPNPSTFAPQSATNTPPTTAPTAVPAKRVLDALSVAPTLDCITMSALIAAQYPSGRRKSCVMYIAATPATAVLMACLAFSAVTALENMVGL